jgi:hypothetical protein
MVPPNLTERMKARNPKLFAGNKTVFENLSSKFQIANGRITAPDLKLATSDFALDGNGWFSLTKEMSVNSTLAFSGIASDLVAEVPAASTCSPDGRLEVPYALRRAAEAAIGGHAGDDGEVPEGMAAGAAAGRDKGKPA